MVESGDVDSIGGVAGIKGEDIEPGHVWLGQQSGAPSDSDIGEGNTALYSKTDGELYKKPYGGSESQVTGAGAGTGVDAEDDGSAVVSGATALNFGSNLSVSDDGDGTATVVGSLTGSGANLANLLSQGLVVWSGQGAWGTEDPSGSTTPVQDAIDNVDGATNDDFAGGYVWLPPGITREAGPLDRLINKRIIGAGIGRADSSTNAEEHGSTILIDGGGDGILCDSWGDVHFTLLDGFALRADDNTDGRAAIRFKDTSNNATHFNIGNLKLEEWTNTTAQANPGIIAWEDNTTWACHWGSLHLIKVDGPGLYRGSGGNPYGVRVGHYEYAPRSPDFAIRSESRLNMSFGHIHSDLQIDGMFNGTLNNFGYLSVDSWSCEPDDNFGANRGAVWKFEGTGGDAGRAVIGPGNIFDSAGSWDQVFEIGADAGGITMWKPELWGTTIDNNIVNVTGAPSHECWYFGPSSDIQNDAGTSTGYVRAMASAGTGVG